MVRDKRPGKIVDEDSFIRGKVLVVVRVSRSNGKAGQH